MRCLLIAVVFCLSGAGAAHSAGLPKVKEAGKVSLGVEMTITSEVLDQDRRFFVSAPANYDGKTPLPVLYLLDAERHYKAIAPVVHYMAEQGTLPEMLVVGIANDRSRGLDLTPDKRKEVTNSGGADKFLKFINTEVKPYIRSEYAVTDFEILAGKSFGGLFALHVLFTDEQSFDAYLILSPSVWWGERMMVQKAEEVVPTLESARFVYFTLSNEEDSMRAPFADMDSIFYALKPAQMRYASKYYNNETHASTKFIAVYDGLRELFKGWFAPDFRRRHGLAGLDDHYAWMKQEIGVDIQPSEVVLLELGVFLLGQDRVEEAIETFQRCADTYPDSPYPYEGLAEGYLAVGDTDKAKEALTNALNASIAKGDGRDWVYREQLQKLENEN